MTRRRVSGAVAKAVVSGWTRGWGQLQTATGQCVVYAKVTGRPLGPREGRGGGEGHPLLPPTGPPAVGRQLIKGRGAGRGGCHSKQQSSVAARPFAQILPRCCSSHLKCHCNAMESLVTPTLSSFVRAPSGLTVCTG